MKKTQEEPAVKPQDTPVTDYAPAAPVQKNNTVLIVLLMLISFFAGYLFFKSQNQEKTIQNLSNETPQAGAGNNGAPQQLPRDVKISKPDPKKDHWRGSQNARYVWVEYSDYECPFCKKNHPDLIKLSTEYKDKLAWVYRHYPLGFHAKAQDTAEAAECVAELGGNDAFWKFTDAVYDQMPTIELADLPALAAKQGLNKARVSSCITSNKYEDKVTKQAQEATDAGINATPTGIIYDMKTGKTLMVEGALPYESLKQALDQFISENS